MGGSGKPGRGAFPGGLVEVMMLLSNVPVLQAALLVELGHAVVAEAAVELQAIGRAMVFGEVPRALLPGIAPLAVLPQLRRSGRLWSGFRACSQVKLLSAAGMTLLEAAQCEARHFGTIMQWADQVEL